MKYWQMFAERAAAIPFAFDVICTTCASVRGGFLDGLQFESVVVDEASQSTDPDIVSAITRGCEHLVLIGDHKQLPPIIVSETVKGCGLDRSRCTARSRC